MFKRFIVLALALCFAATSHRSAQAQEIPKNVKLAKVEYQGLSLYTPGEVNSVAGLKIGQPVALADLEKAAGKLSRWGCFTLVQFSYRYSGTQMTVSFQVVETKNFATCVFDNFVGFKDPQLAAAIRREFPSFKGKVPLSGTFLEDIARILEKFLKQSRTEGKVISSPVHETNYLVFSINDFKAPICKMVFEGDNPELAATLEQAGALLLRTPYSRWQIEAFAKQTLSSYASKRGYWRFGLVDITAEKMDSPDCAGGAAATLSFNSGPQYSWAGVFWLGNVAKSNSELDGELGIKNGDVAARDAIEAGLAKVAASYFRNGYLDYRLKNPNPIIDHKNRTVGYRAEILEGGQYRMGRFLFFGSPSLPIDKLSRQWQAKPGDIFDGLYFEEFREKYFKPWLAANAPSTPLEISYSADRAQRTVNVLVRPPVGSKMK